MQRLTPDLTCRTLREQGPSQYLPGASGSALSLNGWWSFSRCVPIGATEGASFETFEFVDRQLSLALDRHQTADRFNPGRNGCQYLT